MNAVSVIIPVYNGRSFIGKALQSVVGQTLRPFEIIVIDDGSSDDTFNRVELFPVRYQRQEHQGAGAARNLGATLARGEWLAFLDADDIWHANKLATQCSYIEEHPEAAFIYCDIDLVDKGGKLLRQNWASAEFVHKRPNSRQRLSRLIFQGRPFPLPSTVIITRELFQRSGGFSPIFRGKYHEDLEFFARLRETITFHFIDQSLVQHRQHDEHTAMDAEMDRQNWLIFLNCLWQLWQHTPRRQAGLARYFAKHYADAGKRALRAGNYAEAHCSCRLAHAYWPLVTANLRHWALSYLPGLRELCGRRTTKKRST
jgi:glycosyltransferase involved in cell wall biosynthesis